MAYLFKNSFKIYQEAVVISCREICYENFADGRTGKRTDGLNGYIKNSSMQRNISFEGIVGCFLNNLFLIYLVY